MDRVGLRATTKRAVAAGLLTAAQRGNNAFGQLGDGDRDATTVKW